MKQLAFVLVCNCKNRIEGIMCEEDYKETLCCNHCGLVWVIPRPYEEATYETPTI